MLVNTSLLPSDSHLALLDRICAPLDILSIEKPFGSPERILVVASGKPLVSLESDYTEVVFKFECFGMVLLPPFEVPLQHLRKLIRIEDLQEIKCLFRFEWERPVELGEVPRGYEPVLQEQGKEVDVPSSATAIGLVMVGISFWNSARSKPSAVVYIRDSDRMTLQVSDDDEEISHVMAQCECLGLGHVRFWLLNVDERLNAYRAR